MGHIVKHVSVEKYPFNGVTMISITFLQPQHLPK